jgi:hypothetical protein
MQRIASVAFGLFFASVLVPAAHGETRTLVVEGFVNCVSNTVEPQPPGFPCAPLGIVDDSITGGASDPSTFTARATLPKEFGEDGVPFFGGTRYDVPRNEGEFDFSVEIQPETGPSHSFTLGDSPVGVLIQNDSFFGQDSWVVGFTESSSAIEGPNFCSLTFSGSTSVLENENYFVPSSAPSSPFAPWTFVNFGCRVLGAPFPIVILGSAQQVTVIDSVGIDLKPGSDPNCVNPRSEGRTSVAILGSDTFDVADIDQFTLDFGGASPVHCAFEDSLPADGITDLACRYTTRNVEWPAAGSDCGDVELTGELLDGTLMEGSDSACLAGEYTCETAIE